jgi:hypothetical protein
MAWTVMGLSVWYDPTSAPACNATSTIRNTGCLRRVAAFRRAVRHVGSCFMLARIAGRSKVITGRSIDRAVVSVDRLNVVIAPSYRSISGIHVSAARGVPERDVDDATFR